MYERMIEAYPTQMTDSMPVLEFTCGDAAECHADDHVNCTPDEDEYPYEDSTYLAAADGSAQRYFTENAL